MSLQTYISLEAFGSLAQALANEGALQHYTLSLDKETARHMRAARLQKGERFVVANGAGEGFELQLAEKWEARQQKAATLSVCMLGKRHALVCPELTLVQGLAATERMDLVVRQATELGISRILPLASERSQIHLTATDAVKKLARWQRISQAAAEQSGQLTLPELAAPLSLAEALRRTKEHSVRICCWEESTHGSIREVLSSVSPIPAKTPGYLPANPAKGGRRLSHPTTPSVAVFIGPEGGFSAGEVAVLREAGAHMVSLGSTILRTETAALVAVALVLSELGALGAGVPDTAGTSSAAGASGVPDTKGTPGRPGTADTAQERR